MPCCVENTSCVQMEAQTGCTACAAGCVLLPDFPEEEDLMLFLSLCPCPWCFSTWRPTPGLFNRAIEVGKEVIKWEREETEVHDPFWREDALLGQWSCDLMYLLLSPCAPWHIMAKGRARCAAACSEPDRNEPIGWERGEPCEEGENCELCGRQRLKVVGWEEHGWK